MKKRTFEEFIKIIHGLTFADYNSMDKIMQKALEIDYINRYGTPIKWF